MRERGRSPVASEGFIFICIFAFLAWFSAILGFTIFSCAFALLCVLNIFFFRDPERDVPQDKDSLVSPADGRVILIKDAYEKDFLHAKLLKVSISLALYDCHVNRAPMDGRVLSTKYTPGSFNIANMPEWFYFGNIKKASENNERLSTLIEGKNGENLVISQVAGFLARRIVSYAEGGAELKKGERYGIIKFGSRVDVYLPVEYVIEVEVGSRVKAGETVIARLKEHKYD